MAAEPSGGATLCCALRSKIGGDALVFDYAEDFATLWASDKTDGHPGILDRLGEGVRALVVVWDGNPPRQPGLSASDNLLLDHVTPLDWAFSLSSFVLSQGAPVGGRLSIAIIQTIEAAGGDAWALRMRAQLLTDMPWVSIYSPNPEAIERSRSARRRFIRPLMASHAVDSSGVLPGGAVTPAAGEDALLQQAADHTWGVSPALTANPILAHYDVDARERVTALGQQWAASLLQRDDHHDVNNLAGAQAMIRALGITSPSTTSVVLQAFLSRLQWCRQLPKLPAAHRERIRSAASALARRAGGRVNVFLVDDMLDHGWDRIAVELLGLTSSAASSATAARQEAGVMLLGKNRAESVFLYGATSAAALTERLVNAGSFRRRDYGFRIRPETGLRGDLISEVLLLDLRLFATRSRADFERSIRSLWGAVGTIVCADESTNLLAWPSLVGDAVAIDAWLASSSGEPPIEVLTLLPRLLALAYPLLPIILFSSTGRSEIKERLKPYRNVFTAFEKPRLISTPEAFERSISSLENSLVDAGNFVSAAYAFAQLHAYTNQRAVWKKPPVGEDSRYFEIFLDETGSSAKLKSFATVMAFRSEQDANGLQDRIRTAVLEARKGIRTRSPSWVYWRDGVGQPALPPEANRLNKLGRHAGRNEQLASGVKTLKPLLNSEPKTLAFWVAINHLKLPLGPARKDGEYDRMLRLNIEFIVHVLLPMCGATNFQWRVFLPQRVHPVNTLAEAKREKQIWGIDYIAGSAGEPWLLMTYQAGSYYPFVRELAHRWEGSGHELLSGRGIKLNCFESNKDFANEERVSIEWPRWLAGMADWVASACEDATTRKILAEIVADLRLGGAMLSGPVPLELAIEAIREATLPSGSASTMVALFLTSWEGFLIGKARRPPSAEDSRIAHAIYTHLRGRLEVARGEDLISAMLRQPVASEIQEPKSYFGDVSVLRVRTIADDQELAQLAEIRLHDEGDTRVIVGVPFGTPLLREGELFQLELREPTGLLEVEDLGRLDYVRIEPRDIRGRLKSESEADVVRTDECLAPDSPTEEPSVPLKLLSASPILETEATSQIDPRAQLLPSKTSHEADECPAAKTPVPAVRQPPDLAGVMELELVNTAGKTMGNWVVARDRASGSDFALRMDREFRPGELVRCMVTSNSVEAVFGRPPLKRVVPV